LAHEASLQTETIRPGGCPFRARCPERMAICETDAPLLNPITPTHQIACHRVALASQTQSGRSHVLF
jgi:ABC-type dipeptide/oligopeptide/nickel transport system ATPase component